MNDIVRELTRKRHNIWEILSENNKTLLLDKGEKISIGKNQILYRENDEIKHIYFVVSGFVALFRSNRFGEDKVIFICSSGELLNEMVVEKERASVAAKTLGQVELLKIPRDEFSAIMDNDFDFVKAVFSSIFSKTRRLYHQIGNAIGTYPLDKHLATKIWKLARDYGVETSEGIKIEFEVTVTLLANMLGAKRESVSRAVSKFKSQGYIIHEKGYLTVVDLEKIHDLIL